MSGLVMFSDGRCGLLGDDGFVDEFDDIEIDDRALDGPATLGAAFIDIEPDAVIDIEVEQ